MSIKDTIESLYQVVDSNFTRPASLHNLGCCVVSEDEQKLLARPRSELDSDTLSATFGHYYGGESGCFSTFDQFVYFLPRILELFAGGSESYLACSWNALRIDQQKFVDLGLWPHIVDLFVEVFKTHTKRFAIQHFDLRQCQEKGWVLNHFDYVARSEKLDDLLMEFFYPVFSTSDEWQKFFQEWANDSNPHRVAYLLDLLKRRWENRGPKIFVQESIRPDEFVDFTGKLDRSDISELCEWWKDHAVTYDMPLPKQFEFQIDSKEYIETLVIKAADAILTAGSPTWTDDILVLVANRNDSEAQRPIS